MVAEGVVEEAEIQLRLVVPRAVVAVEEAVAKIHLPRLVPLGAVVVEEEVVVEIHLLHLVLQGVVMVVVEEEEEEMVTAT